VSLTTACLLAFVLTGCLSPPSDPQGSIASESASSEASARLGPRFTHGGLNADAYGTRMGYPIGDRLTFYRIPFVVGSHSHLDQIFEGRLIRQASKPSRLTRPVSEPVIHYAYAGEFRTLDDYLMRHPVTGFLVARDETILIEHYQYARNDRHRLASHSMAKTVTAMLVGIALSEGRIHSVDDPVARYVPTLRGTEYGGTSIRNLLQMSSGLQFGERPGACSPPLASSVFADLCVFGDDVVRLVGDTFGQLGAGGVDAIRPFNQRIRPAGIRFSYASADTAVLGLVLRSAVERPVADYLQEKIWRPMGAEADATWLIDRLGQEATFCCLNAVLRDYARFGLLLAHGGRWRGQQIIPAAWIEDATRVRPDQADRWIQVGATLFGYGYQVWIFGGERRMFMAYGVDNQAIFVDPASRLVAVQTAVRDKSNVDPANNEMIALWQGLVRDLGD
jgi:CubicO group peptidase (beta-lactamase class C family)